MSNPITPADPVPQNLEDASPPVAPPDPPAEPAAAAQPEPAAEPAPVAEVPPSPQPEPEPEPNPEPPLRQLRPTIRYTDPNNPLDVAAFDAETWKLILDQTAKIDEAKNEFAVANETAKGAKKIYEARQEQLTQLIAERKEQRGKPQQKTLLDFAGPPAPPVEGQAGTVPVLTTDTSPDPLAELWREVPLTKLVDFGARPKDIDIMADGEFKNGNPNRPLTTMGALADFTAGIGFTAGYVGQLSDFRGMGKGEKGGATRVIDASTEFWNWWGKQGGKEEFARERGLLSANDPGVGGGSGGAAEGQGGGVVVGDAGQHDGSPPAAFLATLGGDAAVVVSTDAEVKDAVWVPTDAERAAAEPAAEEPDDAAEDGTFPLG